MEGRRVGLVLGAGGLVGMAYHAGVLAALEHDLGWDPRTADVIVGTSAGALVGALLRLQVPASDLAAMTVGATLAEAPAAIEAHLLAGPPEYGGRSLRQFVRPPRFPGWTLIASWLRQPWSARPAAALAALLRDGPNLLRDDLSFLGDACPGGWPEGDLRIATVRQRDLRRVVWDQRGEAPFADAVAASCAVPGLFAPVRLDGEAYMDGGVHSFTNADLVAAAGIDVAVVVSPMSTAARASSGLLGLMRRRARRALHAECRSLRRGGATVVTIEPDRDCVDAMGLDLMDAARGRAVVAAGFLGTPPPPTWFDGVMARA